MAIPSAPKENNEDKVLFTVDDNSGTNRANLLRGYRSGLMNGERVAALGVYEVSGGFENGNTTLTGSTALVLASNTPAQWALLKARLTNVGTLYVGKSDVTADTTTATGGWPLEPGESVGIPCNNLSEIFIRGTSGDGVAWIASLD